MKFQDAKLPLVDEVINLDAEYRAAIGEGDTLRANRNKLSKQIGMLLGQAKKDPSKAAEAEEIKKQVAVINQIVAEIGKPKMEYEHAQFNQELFDKIVADFMDEAKAAMDTDDKNVREARWNEMIEHWHEKYLEEYPDMDQYLDEFTYKFQKKSV